MTARQVQGHTIFGQQCQGYRTRSNASRSFNNVQCNQVQAHTTMYFVKVQSHQGCARFPGVLKNFSERQILWGLCSVVCYDLTLRFPIQTSLSVAPKLPVCVRSGVKCPCDMCDLLGVNYCVNFSIAKNGYTTYH